MQEEMQEKILRNIAKNGKLSTEDLAAMLAASPEEIEKEMNAAADLIRSRSAFTSLMR